MLPNWSYRRVVCALEIKLAPEMFRQSAPPNLGETRLPLKTTRIYQNPELDSVRDAIDQRNNREVI
jgi:hypothetical protein